MNQNPQKTNVEQAYRTSVVVWMALLVSQLLLLVVIYFAKPDIFKFDFSKPLLGENPVMVIILALLSISNLVISMVLRRKILNQAIAAQSIAAVLSAMIIGCALCEAISLFGVVLVFAYSYQYFLLWFALGALGMILHFPKRDNFIDASYKKT